MILTVMGMLVPFVVWTGVVYFIGFHDGELNEMMKIRHRPSDEYYNNKKIK